jgi:hypothetical protein
MTRFFFDYRSHGQSLYDYHGHEFRNPQAAIDFAGAIVEDLKNSLDKAWIGWCIEVRNGAGVRFSALPVN